jgi:exopolyphosphatase/guanosine-5'-triphosphate,3'-diphosphate pyrophosphatase
MVFQDGAMASAHTLAIGSQRTGGEVLRSVSTAKQRRVYLEEKVQNATDLLRTETSLESLDLFIAVGGDMRIAGERAGEVVDDTYFLIERRDFDRLVGELSELSEDEIAESLRIPYNEAETLVFALVIYGAFLAATAATRIVVPFVSIRDGVLCTIAASSVEGGHTEYHQQVVSSALNLMRKYRGDERHALHVTDLALRLFDFLQDDHGLDSRQRLLLQVAGILHDIGTFINFSSHHKHGQYVINSSDIFGLHRQELSVVSNVVRYHRRATPQPSHRYYASLPPADRMVVNKLAALLRVADALDRGHQQRIGDLDLELEGDELIVRVRNAGDVSLERFGIETKAQMLEDVYGYKTVLLA